MSIFGKEALRIDYTLDSVDYSKTLDSKDYFYEYMYNKKLVNFKRDIRTGERKQVFKGNEKLYKFTLFNITESTWNNFYKNLSSLNTIKVFPHSDLTYYYSCYCNKIEYKTYQDNQNIGIVEIELVTNTYLDTLIPGFIIQDNILTAGGLLLTGYYLDGTKI